MTDQDLQALLDLVHHTISVEGDTVTVKDPDHFRSHVVDLVRINALGEGRQQAYARFLIRGAAKALGIVPASIHEVYTARGRGDIPPTFTVPAMNLRVLSYDAARIVFQTASAIHAGAFIFEIARSEMGYTDQRPAEYTTNMLAAAITEGYKGPVFIQGDHIQVSASRYAENPDKELQTIKDLIREALEAGFYNIDVDTSTLVDMSFEDVNAQQEINTRLSAELTIFIRSLEPQGVTVSVGGEIGEVGGHNSNEKELRAYTDGYLEKLKVLDPKAEGLSKISIQTGTSHGGTVLPDGSIAEVAVDFDTMLALSRIAREEFGMAGAVQHGASTLPQEAFSKFVEYEACEIHLATNFQNIFFDNAPSGLVDTINSYVKDHFAGEWKEGKTEEQFLYSSRKRAIGPFKQHAWDLSAEEKAPILKAWESQFAHLFNALSIADTKGFVDTFTTLPSGMPTKADYLRAAGVEVVEEDISDLSD
jgi:fructose/tagatose bisphosphate aldolase